VRLAEVVAACVPQRLADEEAHVDGRVDALRRVSGRRIADAHRRTPDRVAVAVDDERTGNPTHRRVVGGSAAGRD
jgi:hypothetical protein